MLQIRLSSFKSFSTEMRGTSFMLGVTRPRTTKKSHLSRQQLLKFGNPGLTPLGHCGAVTWQR